MAATSPAASASSASLRASAARAASTAWRGGSASGKPLPGDVRESALQRKPLANQALAGLARAQRHIGAGDLDGQGDLSIGQPHTGHFARSAGKAIRVTRATIQRVQKRGTRLEAVLPLEGAVDRP